MYIIFGLIVIILEFLVEYLGRILFDMSVSEAFIIGYLLYGLLIGLAIKAGHYIKLKEINAGTVIVSILLITLDFVGINYADYKSTYYNGDKIITYNVFRSNNGEHISNYKYQKDGKSVNFNFLSYEKFKLDNATLQVGPHVGIDEDDTSSPFLNYVMAIVDYI